MAFTILNNTAAQMTLGELNKNISKVGKQLAKLSTGEKISGGGGQRNTPLAKKCVNSFVLWGKTRETYRQG